jgi:hypothetical protein
MKLRLTHVIRGFSEGSRFDWLHPSNGRFPDFAASYANEHGEKFEVLIWDDNFSWVAMVQGPDWYHGGYQHSYRWWPNAPEPTAIWCRPNKGDIYEVKIKWNNEILRQISTASVQMHISNEAYPEGWV